MKPGRRVTIKDIAERLGISHSTVSRALAENPKAPVNSATRQRVLDAAVEMGYSPNLMARAVVTGKSGTLGLITYRIQQFAMYSQAVTAEAHRCGYQVLLGVATDSFSQDMLDDQYVQIEQMTARGVDGLLIHLRESSDQAKRILQAVRGRVPVVAFSYPTLMLPCVAMDREAGFFDLTNHLIRLGHRRIAFIGPDWRGDSLPAAKGKGYCRAMVAHSLEPELIPPGGMEAGYGRGLEIGRLSDRPTALVCRTDETAIGVCRGLQEAGIRVPEDVAVVGAGGVKIGAYFTPPLTTLMFPIEAICRMAIELLLDQLNGNSEIRQVILKPELLVRESCGAKLSGR